MLPDSSHSHHSPDAHHSTDAPAPAERLVDLGWADERASTLPPGTIPGRVARADRTAYDVLTGDGSVRATLRPALLAELAHDRSQLPTVGDWVALGPWPDGPVTIEAVLPRTSAFVRAARWDSSAQVLAANVDSMLIVVSLAVEPDLGRLERFLALGWEGGAEPVVVLTKADLADDADALREEVAAVAVGSDVLVVSCHTGVGIEELRARHVRRGRSLALVGQSGVGKSTLVNALAGAEVMATSVVSDLHGKGRHTTTHRELVLLPGGGILVDTPGLRGVGLVEAAEGISRAFADVEELAQACRFSDCAHQGEPGCAVQAAVDDGTMTVRRLDSWRKLEREQAYMATRHDARLRAEQSKKWRSISKQQRAHYDLKRGGQ